MNDRYAHIAFIKGIPQYVFTSRWAAAAWLRAAIKDNNLPLDAGRVTRLRIVPSTETPGTIGLKLW